MFKSFIPSAILYHGLVTVLLIAVLKECHVTSAANSLSSVLNLSGGGESSSETLSNTRHDDYEDYFEEQPEDDSEIQGVRHIKEPARAQKLSWTLPPVAADNGDIEPMPGQMSLVIVFDATQAMHEELRQLKTAIDKFLQVMNGWERIPPFNYILVTTAPDSGLFVTRDVEKFRNEIENIQLMATTSKCSTTILSALESAITSALPKSFVILFSNSLPKDVAIEDTLPQLIQEKQSSIYIVSSGDNCAGKSHLESSKYNSLSDSGNGFFLNVNKSKIQEVIKNLPHILNNLNVLTKNIKGTHGPIKLPDTFTELTVAISGKNPTISLINSFGYEVKYEPVIITHNWSIVKFPESQSSKWILETKPDPEAQIRIMEMNYLSIDFGFSEDYLEFFNQSSYSPTIGRRNILYLETDIRMANLTMIQMITEEGDHIEMPLSYNETNQLFTTDFFEPPRSPLQLLVLGESSEGNELERVLANKLKGVIGNPPDLTFSEETREIELDKELKITCKVRPFNVATMLMLKRGEKILEMKYSDQPYALSFQRNATKEDEGLFSCSAKNEFGTRVKTVKVIIKEDLQPTTPSELTNLIFVVI